jgi:hypothetical protein
LVPLVLLAAAVAQAQAAFTLTTTAPGSAYYPGENVLLRTTITRTGDEPIRSLGLRVILPFGWTYEGDNTGPEVRTEISGLTVEHVWILPPTFPLTVEWTVAAPETATGPAAFALRLGFRFEGGDTRYQDAAAVLNRSAAPPGLAMLRQRLLNNFTIADADGNGTISPAEALAFGEEYDAETFALLDVNGDGVLDELELAINVLAGLDCGCAPEEAGEAKGKWGDLLLLSALMGSLVAMGVFSPRR